MKKVFLILILFLSCYFIYNSTLDEKKYYLTVGDFLSKGSNEYGVVSYGYSDFLKDYLNKESKLKEYNNTFTNNDYTISDILKALEYNELKNDESLNRLIKKADIITISLGMNDLYNKLEKNSNNIYTYIDRMINDYDKILDYINKFHHDKIIVLGYYNYSNKNEDIFDYANYKLNQICKKYNYYYIDMKNTIEKNPKYFSNNQKLIPNIDGYQKISQIIVENLKNN